MAVSYHKRQLWFFAALIGYDALLVCLVVWFCGVTTHQVYKQLKIEPTNQTVGSNSRYSQSISDARSVRSAMSVNPGLLLVLCSSLLFCLSVIFHFPYIIAVYIGLNQSSDNKLSERRSFQGVLAPLLISNALIFAAYGTLSLAYLGRYQLTFRGTRFSLKNNTVHCIHLLLFLCFTLAVFGALSTAVLSPIWLLIAGFPSAILFEVLCVWQSYKFWNSTHQIATDLTRNAHGNDDSEQRRRSEELLNVSLRLTVVSLAAVLSSWILTSTIFVMIGMNERSEAVMVAAAIYPTDAVINCYSLMCIFRENQQYYDFVFNRFHSWLILKLTSE